MLINIKNNFQFNKFDPSNRRHYKKLIVLSGKNQNVNKEYVLELLKYNNKRELFEELQVWIPPRFPVNGVMLQTHGVPAGKRIGLVLERLKTIWAEGNFEISPDDLLKELPDVLKKLEEGSPKSLSKKPKLIR